MGGSIIAPRGAGFGRIRPCSSSRASSRLAEALGGLEPGDILYVSDRRAWLGGLRSGHGAVAEIVEDEANWLDAPAELCDAVGSDAARVRALY